MQMPVPGRSLADYLLQREMVMQRAPDSREKFDPATCQCCGFKRHKPDDPDCICDGLDWKQFPDGHLRCSAHMAADIIKGESRKRFWQR